LPTAAISGPARASRFNSAVVSYLRAGRAAGMMIPDASDADLKTFRVVAE
jgi:hypothetical protein